MYKKERCSLVMEKNSETVRERRARLLITLEQLDSGLLQKAMHPRSETSISNSGPCRSKCANRKAIPSLA